MARDRPSGLAGTMTSEQVLTLTVRRYVIAGDRPLQDVMDAFYAGISGPDIEGLVRPLEDVMDAICAVISRQNIDGLFRQLATSTSYYKFSALVGHAQGRAGLMR